MRRAVAAGALAGLALALGGGCGDDANTQVIVTIDADPEVKARARVVQVSIYGGVRAAGALPAEGPQQVPFSVVASDAWPVKVALAPKDGDTSRLYRVIATAKNGSDEDIAEVRAISGYVEGETLWLRLYFDEECLDVDPCEQPDQTCSMGECVDARRDEKDLPPFEEDTTDAGVGDGGVECIASEECDDGVSCTLDACDDGSCVFAPNDGACTAGPDGWCDPTNGCQYSVCDGTTCVPDPCQAAECDSGGVCVRTSLCAAGEMCCAGSCVPDGCDDDNPCTDDACGSSGCENAPNDAICDDGMYCNGVDTCGGGTCSVHPGDPCPGASMCDEDLGACTACGSDADCPMDTVTDRGSCTYSTTCAESGTRPVTVAMYSCVDAMCMESTGSDTEPCSRDTDGNTCGVPTITYGPCVPDFPCAITGTQEERTTPRVCSAGGCTDGTTMVTGSVSCTPAPDPGCMDAGVGDGGMDGCAEGVEVDCGDGVDNDCDSLVDCEDPDCDTECMIDDGGFCDTEELVCDDGFDDDCDTFFDCDDADCSGDPACMDAGLGDGGFCDTEEFVCDDGLDDDCDTFFDCDDLDCAGDPACMDAAVGFDGGV